MANEAAQRRAYEMGAGALVLVGSMAFASPSSTVSVVQILVYTLVIAAPALYLLRKASELYVSEVDPFEVVLMMAVGAGVFMFISVFVMSILIHGLSMLGIGVIIVGFILFFTPSAILYLFNTRRRTDRMSTSPIS